MVDMDYLNIDMNICQLLLLRYNDQNLQASGSRVGKMPAFMSKVHAGGIYRYLPAFTGIYRRLLEFIGVY